MSFVRVTQRSTVCNGNVIAVSFVVWCEEVAFNGTSADGTCVQSADGMCVQSADGMSRGSADSAAGAASTPSQQINKWVQADDMRGSPNNYSLQDYLGVTTRPTTRPLT